VNAIATGVEKRLGENSVFYDNWYESVIVGIGDGACQSSWIDQRLRAFDIYQEEIPGITLFVWDKSSGVAKPPRRFRPPFC